MHIRRTRARVVAAAAALALVAGGAAYAGTALQAGKVKVVAIATPAQTNDYGWNQQGVNGAKKAAAAFGAKVTAVTNIGYDKTDVVLRQLAKSGADFIIAHASGYDTVAERIAQQYKVPIMTYDIPTMLVKNYVSNITTESQQGSYLAGILAARMTKTHKVGIVISASDPNWYKMSGGFAAGVRSIDKTAKIVFATIGPAAYDDAAGGKRAANSVIAQGADVILTMGDGATFGYLQAIETAKVGHKVWMIGDIGNLAPIDKKHVFLSSVLWDFTNAYKAAIADINKGTYGTHGYDLTLKNGGISLLRTQYVPTSVWKEIGQAKAGIVAGKIKVPNVTTKSAVLQLIK
ncbi:MAG TPA: BMP family ABC transporter substrate-binding protein [Gaiellaceae bacterium]|nr:BMP family ABC transporter substrate-binding protein [Gaiellaceae bacterium]